MSRANDARVKLVKCQNNCIPIGQPWYEIDAELSIAINNNLRSRMRQRRLEKYKINSAGSISKYHSAVATYTKRCCTGCEPKDVLISMFRISEDFLQENYIVKGNIKTTYYKIVRC